MNRPILALSLSVLAACSSGRMSDAEIAQVRREVAGALAGAYDLSKPAVEQRMLSLYGDTGRLVSASAGRVTTSRDTIAAGIRYFWRAVGVNMKEAKWIWDSSYVDVISPTTAVVTASYHIPHKTPRDQPHIIAGAMTALFVKRDGKWVIIQEHLSDLPQPPDAPSMAPAPTTPRK